ncbi:HAD-IC family P-type ATPase, partial [Lutibacter sp.]|uniref:HAD-IC family P-type ATPase n=1 Tax=Lutibacter sp. TaxID=1925666 RepID=UPI0025B9D626
MSEDCKEGSACAVDYSQETKKINFNKFRHEYVISAIVFVLLVIGILLKEFTKIFIDQDDSLIWFFILYLAIGGQTILKAIILMISRDFYNEFVLMTIATLGAFFINSYAEAVAVMLFYVVGELFQEAAVNKAKSSIESLLKVQVDAVTVLEKGKPVVKHPNKVEIGQIIQVKPGEKVALDGVLVSELGTLNTAALTGESVPDNKEKGETVLAGMININTPIEIKVTTKYADTKLSKILKLVQDATGRKAKTQLLVSRLAKVYTPIVFWLAIALVIIPYFFLGDAYVFQMWFQRALIFLVISCPCALVISIPLG